jgi:hypothetical protein
MKDKKTNKGGRPSKFDTINLKQVEILAKKGFTDVEMSQFFEITQQTFNNWKKKHKEFFESLKDWKKSSDALVEKSLFERATGYEHEEDKIFNANGTPLVVPTIKHYPPETTAGIFWLKNRQPDKWRDKQEIEGNLNLTVNRKEYKPES